MDNTINISTPFDNIPISKNVYVNHYIEDY